MPQFTDMHCHILPGLDDGSLNMQETIEVLKEAQRQHIHQIIVTPHYHPGRYQTTPQAVLDTLAQVNQQIRSNKLQVQLYPGHECYYYTGLIQDLKEGRALTLNNSSYVLVEFEPDCLYSYLQKSLYELRCAGYLPILAHFERYGCLLDMDNLMQIRNSGTMLQLNYDRLIEKDRLFRKNRFRRLFQEGLVDYLGSDCHGMHYRPLQIEKCAEWIEEHTDTAMQRKILHLNFQNIIKK